MAAFPKFDARAFLERQETDGATAKTAKAPKAPKAARALDGLDTLGGARPSVIWGDNEEERAALMEHDGGAPKEWAEAFATLDLAQPPGDVPADRWKLFLDDCGRFLDAGWFQRAEALGWKPFDLFGCDRCRPVAGCLQRTGLIWSIEGTKLIALSENSAVTVAADGTRRTYRRYLCQPYQALAWTPIS